MHTRLHKFILFVPFLGMAMAGLAQTEDSAAVKHPFSHYEGPQSVIRHAVVEWQSLGEHVLESAPELMFLLPRDITLSYSITISEEGTVIYVKPLPCPAEYQEFQKGGIHALYGTKFSSVAKGSGSQKATAIVHFVDPDSIRAPASEQR